ncbi:MAG: FAD:protein FMN transferase [Ilumatobacteraceae bacterium]
MGNTAEVTVVGGTSDSQEFAKQRLQSLEQQWSRFIPTSDISQLNMSIGKPTKVHRDTVTLVKYLVSAHEHSNGYFDPTLLPSLVDLGYGTSMTDSSMSTILPSSRPLLAKPLSLTRIDDAECVVQLPSGITLDPGGLGKGLAADLVATELVESGADGACVNIGGDLRCVGRGPNDDSWNIDIESPFNASTTIAELAVRNGGVATSSTRAKRWHTHRGEVHHLLSPTTRTPLPEDAATPVQVTVVGAEAVWAEIFATAILVAGIAEGLALIQESHLAAMVISGNGDVVANADWKEFLR